MEEKIYIKNSRPMSTKEKILLGLEVACYVATGALAVVTGATIFVGPVMAAVSMGALSVSSFICARAFRIARSAERISGDIEDTFNKILR